MRVLRGVLGSLLLLLAGVLGLLGVLTSVTIILLPVGIPLLFLARKLFKYSMTLFLPRAVRHPVQEAGKSARGAMETGVDKGAKASRKSRKAAGKMRKKADKQVGGKLRKKAGKKARKGSKALRKQRKRLPV